MRLRFDIKGIDCPHCALKLEKMIKDKFENAVINFAASSLIIDAKDSLCEEDVFKIASDIAFNFDSNVKISLRD